MSEFRVLGDDELQPAASTPGLVRRVAFSDEGHWFGHARAEPNAMSGWHHHGDNVTVGYVIEGTATVYFGPGGKESVTASAGQYFTVPAHAVHREGNDTDDGAEIIVARIGTGPPVFPADGPDPE